MTSWVLWCDITWCSNNGCLFHVALLLVVSTRKGTFFHSLFWMWCGSKHRQMIHFWIVCWIENTFSYILTSAFPVLLKEAQSFIVYFGFYMNQKIWLIFELPLVIFQCLHFLFCKSSRGLCGIRFLKRRLCDTTFLD